MKQKIRFLLATIMMLVGITAQAATTITWDTAKLNSMRMVIESTEPASQSKTSDGITVTVAKTVSSAYYYTMEFGSDMMANTKGYFTFESSVGNISKIEINHSSFGSCRSGGTGWPDDYFNYDDGGGTFTWSGTPVASVTLTGTQGDAFASISSIVFTIEDPADASTLFDLTLADGSDAHGTVAFTVDGAAATQAKKDDVVTVSVTPAEGFSTKDVTVRAYTSWDFAGAPRRDIGMQDEIAVTKQQDGT